jgi:ActR/RegA family two-component response regulator
MSASTQQPTAREPPSKPLDRILVVDDDVDFAESLASLLELRGYATKVAHNSSRALALAKTFEPDVALIDIRLGRENGLVLVTDLKERHPGIDCILVTAHADLDTAIEAVWRERPGTCSVEMVIQRYSVLPWR